MPGGSTGPPPFYRVECYRGLYAIKISTIPSWHQAELEIRIGDSRVLALGFFYLQHRNALFFIQYPYPRRAELLITPCILRVEQLRTPSTINHGAPTKLINEASRWKYPALPT